MSHDRPASGPLVGVRVVELDAIGPVPFCAMVLGDLGADVLRVDRPEHVGAEEPEQTGTDVLHRGRASVAVDLHHPDGVGLLLDLVARADVLLEGFRPGTAERLGLGPETVLARNPRLVYGRMSGFGRDGPLAGAAGHDINALALSGVLSAMGPAEQPPVPTLNLVGDFGGGLLLAVGVLAALRARDGDVGGQVVDTSILDAAALLMSPNLPYLQLGTWTRQRGENIVDGGAPYYRAYEAADGRFVAFGAFERAFYEQMLRGLGLDDVDPTRQDDREQWPGLRDRIESVVRSRTRDEWIAIFEGRDACLSPVLEPSELVEHPHHRARRAFVEPGGLVQAAPSPRFSATPLRAPERRGCRPGEDGRSALRAWGVEGADALVARGVVVEPPGVERS